MQTFYLLTNISVKYFLQKNIKQISIWTISRQIEKNIALSIFICMGVLGFKCKIFADFFTKGAWGSNSIQLFKLIFHAGYFFPMGGEGGGIAVDWLKEQFDF